MNTEDAKTDTPTVSSGSFLPFKKRVKLHNNAPNSALEVVVSGNAKYKGVVLQPNGHWGAQLYADHDRFWLGTFRSAAEAAAAYDSASIKIRGFEANLHRNFPWNEYTVHEPAFQNEHITEDVLNMIKDGTYQRKFREFFKKIQYKIGARYNVVGSKEDQEAKKRFSCRELFRKELTPSDVGKLNRLVIPKKYAVKYLPFISNGREGGEEGGIGEDVEVVVYDRGMIQWKFRYCYWRSSQSFVFTRGWNGFVKEKSLKEKDVITFYTCDVPTLQGQSKSFLMIDVDCSSDDGSALRDEEVNETVCNSSEGEVKTETKSVENKGGFMLFGVRIQ